MNNTNNSANQTPEQSPMQLLNIIYNFSRRVVTVAEEHDNIRVACEKLAQFIQNTQSVQNQPVATNPKSSRSPKVVRDDNVDEANLR